MNLKITHIDTGILIDLPNGEQIWCAETSNAAFHDQGEDACAMLGGNNSGLFLHHSKNDGTGITILARVANLEVGDTLARAFAQERLRFAESQHKGDSR